MNKKELSKFFCYMFLTLCLIALIILGICSFFYYLVPIDFPGTVGEWITSLSALAGGALTLGGVWWTINYEKKAREEDFKTQEERRQEDFNNQEVQRKKDLAIQYKPIIDITRDTSNDNDFNEYYVHEESNELYLPITVTNLGRGEALNIIIKNCFSKNILFTIRKKFLYKEKKFHDFIIIPIKYLQQTLYTKANGKVSECYELNHFITIEYSDAFNNKYSDIFQINFKISKEFDIILQDSIEKVD